MAKKTSVIITDDIDGSSEATTVVFAYQGSSYEIDLASGNAAEFELAVTPYVDAARKVSSQRRRAAPQSANAASRPDRAAVRAWARDQGLKVSERGRISAEIVARYEAAQG